jgi:Kef-type K+ transport system membrane component KefB
VGKLGQMDVMLLFIQLGVMLLAGRFLAEIARMFKQPAVVGELIAGILLGPTILGIISPDTFESLFPAMSSSGIVLSGIVQMAVVMLLFIAGLEVDLHIVMQQGRQAVYTSFFGLIIPFAFGFLIPYYHPEWFGSEAEAMHLPFALFMGTSMSITALPVIARILMDLGIFKSRIGMLIISSAMINDIIGWLIFSVVLGLIGKGQQNISLINSLLLTVGFTVLMLTIGRAFLNRILPWMNKKLAWPGGVLSISLTLCFLGAAFTEYIGIHAIFGAFIIGIALGDSEHFSERAKEIVHQFINNIFAPLFFVSIGLRVNFVANFDWALTLIILIIAFAGKIIGSGLGTRLGGFTWRESLAAAFGMNARGAMEIILGLIALESGLIGERLFVSLVIMALLTSIASGPLMKWMLRKS